MVCASFGLTSIALPDSQATQHTIGLKRYASPNETVDSRINHTAMQAEANQKKDQKMNLP